MVLNRTEQGVQVVAEKVLQSTQDRIATLPAVARRATSSNKSDQNVRHKKQR